MDALLIRRLAVISNFPFSSFDRLDLQSITACLQCTDKFLAMCWLKTMCNGWCTTTRMHEANKLNCVLGCIGQSDSLQHYLICPIMNALLDEHFQFCIGPTVYHRLNLVASSSQCAVLLASSYVAYHFETRSQASG